MKSLLLISLFLVTITESRSVLADTVDKADEFATRSRRYLLSSWSAGCPEAELRNWTCYWCVFPGAPKVTVTHYFNGEENQIFGFGGYTQDHIVFSFRGTRGVANILQDLKYFQAAPFHNEIPDAMVHQGFLEAYMSLRDSIISAAGELSKRFPKLPLLVTGHSLGGAIATLAAVDFALNKTVTNEVLLWTYGSPRVGNDAFADFIDSKYVNATRVTYKRDPIPHLPPKVVNYQHHNTEYWFQSASSYQRCPETEDPNCIDSVWLSSPWDHGQYLGIDSTLAHAYGCGGLFNNGNNNPVMV